MKKITFAALLLLTGIAFSSFVTVRNEPGSVQVKKLFTGDETFYFELGIGPGAREFTMYVERQGNEAGIGNVEFDVDVMYNGNSSQIETHHVSISNGQLTYFSHKQSYTVIGTDIEVVGTPYNIVYY